MLLMVREGTELSGYGYRDRYKYELSLKKEKELEKISNPTLEQQHKLQQLKKHYLNKGEN